jgi:poly(3-hydroxybutyrate) depolymerase
MMYALYQQYEDLVNTTSAFAASISASIDLLPPALQSTLPVRAMRANAQMAMHSRLTHARRPFGVDTVEVGGERVDVSPVVVDSTPFCSLVRFAKETALPQPRVLLIAPMSGHFATLLRETVRTLSRDNDVYLTDWHNARDIPLSAGPFDLDHYVEHLTGFIEHLGAPIHVVAVCQPCVPALAATALLAQSGSDAQPRTLTLMAGPVDTRISPSKVNELAVSQPLEWFQSNLISTVPRRFLGSGRRVYPGFLQISAFVSMNLDRHVKAHIELWGNIVRNETESAQTKREFYDEYFAVGDLPAEYYLETVRRVFQEHELARGQMNVGGKLVDPTAIRRTALLTVEGERDDICSVGQTMAAHDLCTRIRPARRGHHLQAGVGHYGVFSGSRWDGEIYPQLKNFILAND